MRAPMALPARPGWVGEFHAFILRGNVVDLAVGIVIGAAFTAIVNSLAKDLFTPVLGPALGGIDFGNPVVTLRGDRLPTLDAAQKAGTVTLDTGPFLNAVVSFLIVSFAIFWAVELLSRFKAKAAESSAALSTTGQTLIDIRDLLRQAPRT